MTGYQSKKAAAQAKLDSMEREALKMALEELADRFSEGWHEGIKIDASDIMLLSEAAQALALAQPAQEPVAWMYDWFCDGKLITGWIAHSESEIPKSMALNIRPLYTTPPQRPWVDLTDEEFHDLQIENIDDPWANFKAIEAKLKEKNNG